MRKIELLIQLLTQSGLTKQEVGPVPYILGCCSHHIHHIAHGACQKLNAAACQGFCVPSNSCLPDSPLFPNPHNFLNACWRGIILLLYSDLGKLHFELFCFFFFY